MTNELADIPPLLGARERLREDVSRHLVRIAIVQGHCTRNNLFMKPSKVHSVRPRQLPDGVASAGLHDPDGRLVVLLQIKVDLAAQHFVP